MKRIEAIPGVVGIQEGGHGIPPAIRFGDLVIEFKDPVWASILQIALARYVQDQLAKSSG